jgi:ParB-like chromosome segregation protein Spo0J
MNKLQIETRTLDQIRPYHRNPRKNERATQAVAMSIQEYGFSVPIIVDGAGVIIAGHTRYAAAQRLQMEEVPVIVKTDLTPEQVQAFRIADNKVAEYSG